MKYLTPILQWLTAATTAIPTIVFLGLGFIAYTKVTEWQAAEHQRDKTVVAGVVASMRAVNDTAAALEQRLAQHRVERQVVYVKVQAERKAQDSTLAQHPVALAPAACAPYVGVVASCQRVQALQQRAIDTLTADLDSTRRQLAHADSVAQRGAQALDKAGKCRFPCIHFNVIAGGGLGTDGHFHKGIFAGLTIR